MQHLIFDFDGVIADTYDMNWKIVHELFPEVEEQAYRIDHHRGNVFAESVVPFTPETVEAYYVHYRERLQIEHVAWAVPTLRRLADQYHMHIVSSNCEIAITQVLT
jgi:phosphoglycolate phosphatase-like HAD superfamily hydrolase